MCGRFTITLLREPFAIPEWRPRYNAAPGQELPIVAQAFHPRFATWGIGTRINARVETLGGSRLARCLVPATGFYEWPGPIHATVPGEELVAFAGLWDERSNAFLIVTTPATPQFRRIHKRMPLILRRDDEGAWLRSEPVRPYDGSLALVTVSGKVNDPRNEGPELLEPVPTLAASLDKQAQDS